MTLTIAWSPCIKNKSLTSKEYSAKKFNILWSSNGILFFPSTWSPPDSFSISSNSSTVAFVIGLPTLINRWSELPKQVDLNSLVETERNKSFFSIDKMSSSSGASEAKLSVGSDELSIEIVILTIDFSPGRIRPLVGLRWSQDGVRATKPGLGMNFHSAMTVPMLMISIWRVSGFRYSTRSNCIAGEGDILTSGNESFSNLSTEG